MKKIFLLLVFFTVYSYSQTNSETEKIIKEYNHSNVKKLKEDFKSKDKLRNLRINNYLLTNKSESKEFYLNDVKYSIRDIVDGKPIYIATDNRLSALASKTNTLYPGGNLGLNLTGAGMTVGIWDGGWALVNHQDFLGSTSSRVSTPDTTTINPTADFHATHVIGTVGATGVNSNAKGMAYEANLLSYNWTSDETEVIDAASINGLLISNHSYGVPIYNSSGAQNVSDWYMGCYNSDARDWDLIAYNSPYYLMVTSAGNSGTETYSNGLAPGLDKLTGNKNSKNNLVIANANPSVNVITGALTNLAINSSSSQGPSDDGRIKPDIAVDGTNVFSTSNASTTSYDNSTGTSMASPGAAGNLILLQQHYNNIHSNFMKAATLKGLVCHTAIDDINNIGPDPYFGWGFLNASAAAQTITNASSAVPNAIIQELNVTQSGSTNTYTIQVTVNAPQTLKATLCWTDVAGGSKDNQLNSSSPALVNDLDLRIIKNTETFFPWKLDLANLNSPAIKGDNIVDNVEKVEVENASGTYTIQVTKKGFIPGGSQAFSLIVSGFDQLALDSKSFKSNISIYPNPTNDRLYISSGNNSIYNFKIIDVQGRVVDTQKVNALNELEINMNNFMSGMYLVVLETEYGTSTHKIVKK